MQEASFAMKRKNAVSFGGGYAASAAYTDDKPNALTVEAFDEMEAIKSNPSLAKSYASFDALLQDVRDGMDKGEL